MSRSDRVPQDPSEPSVAIDLSRRKALPESDAQDRPSLQAVRNSVIEATRTATPYLTMLRIVVARLSADRLARAGALVLATLALVAVFADVLASAEPTNDGIVVRFDGADRGPHHGNSDVRFERALSLEHALDPAAEILIAYEMNGEPLNADHGAPFRLIVPRWYAVASVKWLTRISVLTAPFEGAFKTVRYMYDWPDRTSEPVKLVLPRAKISTPVSGTTIPEPKPFPSDCVMLATFPCSSTAARCVVSPSIFPGRTGSGAAVPRRDHRHLRVGNGSRAVDAPGRDRRSGGAAARPSQR